MKKIIFILLIAMLCSCSTQLDKTNLKSVTFDTSIHCENCVNTMFDNLPKEAGVVDLNVELDSKAVTIVFNPVETTIEKLADRINELGYSAFIKNLRDYNTTQVSNP